MNPNNLENLDINAKKYLEMITDSTLRSLLQQAKLIMKHSRKEKLTVEDFQRAVRINNVDALLGYRNNPALQIKSNENQQGNLSIKDEIVSVSDILDARIPDLPVETSFEVNWFVVNGKQIDYIETYNKDKSQEDDKNVDLQLRNPSIHTLSFECELYLKNIKATMFSNDMLKKTEIYHQLQLDQGLKQILPYLIHWIESEVQSIMRTKPEGMLSYLNYLMHLTHSLVLNSSLNLVLYLHLLLPCILSCCVGKTLCAFPDENHWELRNLSAVIIAEVNKRFGNEYPKMYKQILITLNKVLHNPKSTLPCIYGVIECITRLGENTIELVLLPVYKEIVMNLDIVLKTTTSAITHMQAHRCLYSIMQSIGIYWQSIQQKLILSDNAEIIGKDMNDLISKLPACNELPFSDALLPLCYKHVDGLWDICDIVISIVCLTNTVLEN